MFDFSTILEVNPYRTALMEFVWASVILVGAAFCADLFYQSVAMYRHCKNEARKEYFPLDFEAATGFHFIKDSNENDSFNVFDSHNLLVYKIYKKPRQKSRFREEWIVSRTIDQVEMATVNIGWLFHRSYIYFNLGARYVENSGVNSAAISSPVPQAEPSGRLTTMTSTSRVVPYIDSSLAQNIIISQESLGPLIRLETNNDLKKYEARKLYKVVVETHKFYKYSCFKVAKNSMNYVWKSNGYLEKAPKTKKDLSQNDFWCERIGMVRFQNNSGTDFWLYVNEDRVEDMAGITTAFLHYKSSLWKAKRLSHTS